jgi:hypothetical protein
MRLKGVVDASALHPAALRDLVLGLAQGEFFDIRWSPTTIDEMRDRIRHSKPYLAVHRLDAIANSMREVFPEADVFYEDDETARKLTSDERYRHVVAAAFFDAAHFVVTAKRDFPMHVCCSLGIAVWTPDRLACQCFREDAELVLQILTEQAARLNPPRDSGEVLGALLSHVPRFVQQAGEHVQVLPWVERPQSKPLTESLEVDDEDPTQGRYDLDL